MVSNAREDFPEPDRPVTTTSLLRGIVTSMPFRLCSRAPLTTMAPVIGRPPGAGAGWRGSSGTVSLDSGQDFRGLGGGRPPRCSQAVVPEANLKADGAVDRPLPDPWSAHGAPSRLARMILPET